MIKAPEAFILRPYLHLVILLQLLQLLLQYNFNKNFNTTSKQIYVIIIFYIFIYQMHFYQLRRIFFCAIYPQSRTNLWLNVYTNIVKDHLCLRKVKRSFLYVVNYQILHDSVTLPGYMLELDSYRKA